jgi:transcriptional regulatory protein LevR
VCKEEMPGSLGIRQEISKAFKLHGYSLKVEASRHLEQLLTPIQDRSKWIEAILDTLGKKDLQSANLDKQILEKIIKVLAPSVPSVPQQSFLCMFVSLSANFRNCKN